MKADYQHFSETSETIEKSFEQFVSLQSLSQCRIKFSSKTCKSWKAESVGEVRSRAIQRIG